VRYFAGEAMGSMQRFVVPRRDASWLTEPPPDRWPGLLAANHAALSPSDYDCQGRTLSELRRITQQHVARAARQFTSELLGREVSVPESSQWIVTGHQPELFHIGVWAKNFAVDRLARNAGAVGLNLLIDNDTHSGTGIAVPIGSRSAPKLETVSFAEPAPTCPWEELALTDREFFAGFPQRVEESLRRWGFEPILREVWPAGVAYAHRIPQPRLCDALAAVRADAERRFGLQNLELPLSRVEEQPGFFWFAANVLARLPRFRELYNAGVRAYRDHNRLRSRSHPVPELALEDDWHEAPFWTWRAGEAQRQRVFAQQNGNELLLRDARGVFAKLPLTPDRSACCAVEALATLPKHGIRLRSRALTTTLFARLFLADVFIHGIGGAKYDEMTDELIAKFYGLPVPSYATVSAALHLPLGGAWQAGPQQIGEAAQALWMLEHNPERFLDRLSPGESALVAEKNRLIAEQHEREALPRRRRSAREREQNRRRYRRLREINRLLQPAVANAKQQWQSRREQLVAERGANRILGSREFAWALFPEERLRDFFAAAPF
jgi:hypothetical protein